MGQTFIEAINNHYPDVTFTGTIGLQGCMYFVENLLTVAPGLTNVGIEYKNSGSCFGNASYFVVYYAMPTTTPGNYNFAIGLCSQSQKLQQGGRWVTSSMQHGGSTAYVWTLPNGVNVTLDSFPSGTISQSIVAPPEGADVTPESAPPFELTIVAAEGGNND